MDIMRCYDTLLSLKSITDRFTSQSRLSVELVQVCGVCCSEVRWAVSDGLPP